MPDLNAVRNGDQTQLTNADLSGAALRHANLKDATLTNADLAGADPREADLRSATLDGATLPNGFSPP
jgi:uncharacterized protein YjbI with pentapeptide repeats